MMRGGFPDDRPGTYLADIKLWALEMQARQLSKCLGLEEHVPAKQYGPWGAKLRQAAAGQLPAAASWCGLTAADQTDTKAHGSSPHAAWGSHGTHESAGEQLHSAASRLGQWSWIGMCCTGARITAAACLWKQGLPMQELAGGQNLPGLSENSLRREALNLEALLPTAGSGCV